MRKLIPFVAFPTVGLITLACGRRPNNSDAMAADVQRDLNLAMSAPRALRISPDEVRPESKSLQGVSIRRAAGPRVTPSDQPSLAASRSETQRIDLPQKLPDPQMTSVATATSPVIGVTPAPAPIPAPSAGESSEPGERSGVFDPAHGIVPRGTVIRGGGVGDDHCDPKRDPRGGGVWGGGIFRPGGGMGTGRAIP